MNAMVKAAAVAAGLCVGIATAILFGLMTSVLDGVVDARKAPWPLLATAFAGFALVFSGGLGIAVYRLVKERFTARRAAKTPN